MSTRFFVPRIAPHSTLQLEGDQAHHALHVMRFGPGDGITLFDGQGAEYDARIQTVGKRSLEVQVLQRRDVQREADVDLTLAVALPKGDRQKWLIEKLVELGVRRLVPLETERAVAVVNDKVRSRLEKQVIEACKQCHRNQLMTIESTQSLASLKDWALARLPAGTPTWIGSPQGGQPAAAVRGPAHLVLIGPEGGFSDSEFEQAVAAGAQPLSLGNAVLRVETAALAAAAILGQVALGG